MSKYGSFSGPCFPVLGLNTEIYRVNLCIQSEYRKIRTSKNSVFGHFSHSDILLKKFSFFFKTKWLLIKKFKWTLARSNIMTCWNSSGVSEESQRFHLFQSFSSNFVKLRWNSNTILLEWCIDFSVEREEQYCTTR